MATLYQVRDWDRLFETHISRKLERLNYVPVPNKQHGMGFTRVVAEPDGAAIYGVWIMIVGACSQQRKPRLGWLTDNGQVTGTPWLTTDLAAKFRRPVDEITRALDVLTGPRVGWMHKIQEVDLEQHLMSLALSSELDGDNDDTKRQIDGREREKSGYITEQNKTEQNKTLPPNPPKRGVSSEGFEEFWKAYPRKVGKLKALEAWGKLRCSARLVSVLEAVAAQSRSEMWTKEGGRWIPYPATWINQGRWDDILTVQTPKDANAKNGF